MPARLVIEGGVPLRGAVAASAAKKAALPALAASLLTTEPLVLDNGSIRGYGPRDAMLENLNKPPPSGPPAQTASASSANQAARPAHQTAAVPA